MAARFFLAPAALAVLILAFGITATSIYQIQLMTLAGIMAVAAIGLTLLSGGAGQISIGHAAFMGTGAYVAVGLMTALKLPWLLAALGGTLAAALLGVVLGYSALRLKGHYLALATLAFSMMFPDIVREIQTGGYSNVPPLNLFGYEPFHPRETYFVVWAATGVAYLLGMSLLASRAGRALRAVREDELAAGTTGVDVAGYKIRIFVFSAALAGFAGVLLASQVGHISNTSFTILLSADLLIMVVVGGLGSLPGAVLGAVFLTLVPELGRELERLRLTLYGLALVLVIVFLPRGLAGLATDLGRLATRARSRPGAPGSRAPAPAATDA